MSHYKVGIIGLWHIASKHIEVLQKLGVENIYGYDIHREKIQAFEEKYTIRGCKSATEIIDTCDIISVCTPHDTHMEYISGIHAKGKISLCEKPLCIHTSEWWVFQNTFPENSYIMLQNRYNLAVQEAKKTLDSGILWEIYHIKGYTQWNRDDAYYQWSSWKGKKKREGGMLYNQAIHNLDTALWLSHFSERALWDIQILQATKERFRIFPIETEDFFSCTLKLWEIVYDFSILTYGDREHHENSLLFLGTKWSLKIGGKALNQIEYICGTDIQTSENRGEAVNDIYGSGHYKIYKDLLENNTQNIPRFADGMLSVALIEKLYEKSEQN